MEEVARLRNDNATHLKIITSLQGTLSLMENNSESHNLTKFSSNN